MKRLENKVAVVYRDGTVGGAIATAFAREGASVFLTGRTGTKLDALADNIDRWRSHRGEKKFQKIDLQYDPAIGTKEKIQKNDYNRFYHYLIGRPNSERGIRCHQ